jgi:hypothetical protein
MLANLPLQLDCSAFFPTPLPHRRLQDTVTTSLEVLVCGRRLSPLPAKGGAGSKQRYSK